MSAASNNPTLHDLCDGSIPSPRRKSVHRYVASAPLTGHSSQTRGVFGPSAEPVGGAKTQVTAKPAHHGKADDMHLTVPPAIQGEPTHETQLLPVLLNKVVPANPSALPGRHDHLFWAAVQRMMENDLGDTYAGTYEEPGPSAHQNKDKTQPAEAEEFEPTLMALHGRGFQRPRTNGEMIRAAGTQMSPNYLGDPGDQHNHSVKNLPWYRNTAFWMQYLPTDVSYNEVLDAIKDCGRIYCIHISRDEAHVHGHAACKVGFMDVDGATAFHNKHVIYQTFRIRGQYVFVKRNRVRIPEQFGLGRDVTRCLLITGPSEVVDVMTLLDEFREKFKFQIQNIIPHLNLEPNMSTVEIQFASYRGQASVAKKLLTKVSFYKNHGVTVEFARDPCDRLPQPMGMIQQAQPVGMVQQSQPVGMIQHPQPMAMDQQAQQFGMVQQVPGFGMIQSPQPFGLVQHAQPVEVFQHGQQFGVQQPQQFGAIQDPRQFGVIQNAQPAGMVQHAQAFGMLRQPQPVGVIQDAHQFGMIQHGQQFGTVHDAQQLGMIQYQQF